MKKSIKEEPKTDSENIEDTRPYTAEDKGYKEEVYNREEQKEFDKSELAENKKPNTTGAKS